MRLACRAFAVTIGAIVLTAGCSTSWRAPDAPLRDYPQRERPIDLAVVLELRPEWREAKWQPDGGRSMLVGPALANNAEVLARHVFREVTVADTVAPGPSADIRL